MEPLSGLRDRIIELAIIWDRESIEPAEDFADAVMALVADADPTELGYVEMEVITRYEGPGYMAEPVPYLTPVRWEDGYAEHRPQDLRIYARPRPEETPDA